MGWYMEDIESVETRMNSLFDVQKINTAFKRSKISLVWNFKASDFNKFPQLGVVCITYNFAPTVDDCFYIQRSKVYKE